MKNIYLIFFLSFTLLGCNNSLVKELIRAPEVKAVRLVDFSMVDKKVVFDVDLYNPNAFALPIKGISGNFKLNGLAIGSVQATSKQQLTAHDTQAVTVPIQFDTNALTNAAKSVLAQQKAAYSFNGLIDTSVAPVPFVKSGELSAQKIISDMLF